MSQNEELTEEYIQRSIEFLEDLKKAKDIQIVRFKKTDRIKWKTDKLRLSATLRGKIEDIHYISLKEYLLNVGK